MALLPWRKGIVKRIREEAPLTRRYWIEIQDTDNFEFTAGQFVTLDLPIHEMPSRRWRSYSIASWPDGTNVIELVIVLLEGGAGSTYIFHEIEEGSEFILRGPLGVFTLPVPIEKELFLICTGTGIAPFRSMINDIFLNDIPHQKIHLIFGCRKKENLLYYREMVALEKKMPKLFYYPTLSREEWEGRTGYVHAIYEELVRHTPPAQFFLCGWKNMIDEAKQRIVALGYERKAIHQELYG
ncbi:MAG: FAD-dependent oxidoreductase [Chitinophagaceae bacterium]|nr:FAD-dependent oxidoreductase [Chitinophagaceae bacterium]